MPQNIFIFCGKPHSLNDPIEIWLKSTEIQIQITLATPHRLGFTTLEHGSKILKIQSNQKTIMGVKSWTHSEKANQNADKSITITMPEKNVKLKNLKFVAYVPYWYIH